MAGFDLNNYLIRKRELVDRRLDELLRDQEVPEARSRLVEAMRYSLFAGGKRLRPILSIAGHELFAPLSDYALDAACALEMLHTYSLIHDDLPSFDDDGLRRGQPTNHVVFGDWMAILAGDGLNTLAFNVLSGGTAGLAEELKLEAVRIISRAAGPMGMVLGQAMDMSFEREPHTAEEITLMQELKTGRMIAASAELGAVLAGASGEDRRRLKKYGTLLGKAFQIKDDLLDMEGREGDIGKHPGKDGSAGKATLPSLVGPEKAREQARELVAAAMKELTPYGEDARPLQALAEFVVARRS